jgi:hypothetical protein
VYNIRLSLRKAVLHRSTNVHTAAQSHRPLRSAVTNHLSLAVFGLLTIDLLLFVLLILRILETRGG